MSAIRIAIADDYAVFREGLKLILPATDGFETVLEAGDGAALLNGLEKNRPDVILLDIRMPVMDGITATKKIRSGYPEIKILIVSMYEDEVFLTRLMDAGAHGYLLKNAEPEEMRLAVRAVYHNGYYFNDQADRQLLLKMTKDHRLQPSFRTNLTLDAAEEAFLHELISGPWPLNDLGKEKETIKKGLLKKTGAYNNAGLLLFAANKGFAD